MKNDTYSLSYFMQKVAVEVKDPTKAPIKIPERDMNLAKAKVAKWRKTADKPTQQTTEEIDKQWDYFQRHGKFINARYTPSQQIDVTKAIGFFDKHKDLDYKKILRDAAGQISADIIRKKKNNIPLTAAEKASIAGNVLWEGGLNQEQRSKMLRYARYMDTYKRNESQRGATTTAIGRPWYKNLTPMAIYHYYNGDYDANRPLQNADYKANPYTIEEKLVDYYAKHAPDSWISDKQLLDSPTAQHESAKAQEKIHNAAAPWVNFGKWALPIAGLGIPLAALWAMWGRNKKKGGTQQPRPANPYEQGYAYSYNRQRPPSKRSPYQRSPFNIRG